MGLARDIDEHMSAFNVEEFVQEYEKEILERLSNHLENSSEDKNRDPLETLKAIKRKQGEIESATLLLSSDSKSNL